MDTQSALVDEVALEGLDGITLPSLWLRLEDRKPKFPQKIDDFTKAFLWRCLVHNPEISFYEQPQERDDVELYDRFKSIDPDTGIEFKGHSFENRKDVYPAHFIMEHPAGIQGSCVFFTERKDVTRQIRSASLSPLLNLDQAWDRFGRRLVVVASQKVRFRALIGTESEPELKLSDESYCVLERVGRSRWQGELQRDLSNGPFKIEARKIHYLRKSLVQHSLVTVQSHVCRLSSGTQQHSCLLLLRRFHVNRRSKYDILMERVSNILEASPGQHCTQMALREHLNVDERSFKRIFQYMRASKLVELFTTPLQDLDSESGPCLNKRGNKVQVRCIKLLKPFSKKNVPDDDEDEEEEGADVRPEGCIMERDVLSQAYNMVVLSGTKGLTCVGLGAKMNVGKLERRMICRQLEREGVIKGFMEDMGRQRTTKYLSHKCVEVSDKLHQFVKEHERSQLLCSNTTPDSPKPPSTTKTLSNIDMCRTLVVKKKMRSQTGTKGKGSREKERPRDSKVELGEDPEACEEPASEPLTAAKEDPPSGPSQAEGAKDIMTVITDVQPPLPPSRNHETCRLLRRKNLIVEAIQDLKIFEGLYPLQKIISAEEKRLGFSTKCCKKTILRLVQTLAREGLVKLYTTTVIQDGLTRKVDLYAHPSIQSSDEIVQRTIDQVRFKMSSSYSNTRVPEEEKSRGHKDTEGTLSSQSKAQKQKKSTHKKDTFNPTTVRGLSKSFGYQPKMHRMRVVHNFLWYMVYGHPLRHNPETQAFEKSKPSQTSDPAEEGLKGAEEGIHGAEKGANDVKEGPQGAEQGSQVTEEGNNAAEVGEPCAKDEPQGAEESSKGVKEWPKDGEEVPQRVEEESQSAGGAEPETDIISISENMSLSEEEEEVPQSEIKVYSEEEPWKKYIPPVKLHKDYSSGWVMLGDLILCLPLSIFVQVIQVNYKVDGLEDYLNDPEKEHYLVRCLPARMKRQLLYKRRYIFSFYENLVKLAYMGLIQFGPLEKFRDKDQVFIYVKRHATIVDTTSSEPHYWLVTEPPDQPFERRHYNFNTAEDIESFWFDLMCVCLNTPLGVIRSKRNGGETDPSFVRDRSVFVGMSYLIKGSLEVVDDGSIPGDGRGAGGLSSEFFAHLKRNWLWTNHLLAVKPRHTGLEAKDTKVRLKSLCRNSLQMVLQAEGSAMPSYLTTKKSLITEEDIQVVEEPACRKKQRMGGKQQKRKRQKKEVVRVPRKKKEPKKRSLAHDERDHEALKQMTRQRVYWSLQEDSLMMLCAVAARLLNSKLKRPFVPYCVVRDILHKEFEKSRDKTSLAVGRRTRYILKNPQTIHHYKTCLVEVSHDKALLKLLEENLPKNPDNPEACAESFSEYVRLLRHKFSSTIDVSEGHIPDSKEELFSQFKICAMDSMRRRLCDKDTLNTSEDIHAIVLHNLIQSTLAMTNSQMKSSRSFQMFHVYSSYSQELLCQVFIQCRKRGLVNRRRINQNLGPKKNRALPILPMSYQLSHAYYRCFSWRFPQVLCTDSFCFVRDLLKLPRGDYRPVTYFHQETENRAPDGDLVEPRKTSTDRKDKPASENSNPCELAEMDWEEPTGVDSPDVSDMLQFSLEHPGGACVAALSLMSLGLLSVYLSIPKRMVVVDSALVDTDTVKSTLDEEEEDEEDAEETKKMEVKAHQASHTKYLMMKGYCAPGIVKLRNLSTNDNIVVESCVMRLQLRDRPAHSIFSLDSDPALDLSKCGPTLLPPGLSHSLSTPPLSAEECLLGLQEHRGYSTEDLQACTLLWDTLDQAGERGLDVGQFNQRHGELELFQPPRTRTVQQYMQDLQQEGQVLLVGAHGARWVLRLHADPWLITPNMGQWSRTLPEDLSIPRIKYDIPFMMKKRPLAMDSTEESSAKRQALDTCGDGGEGTSTEGPALDTCRDIGEGRPKEQLKGAEEETSHAVKVSRGPEDQVELGEGDENRKSQPEQTEEEGMNAQPEEEREKTGADGDKEEEKGADETGSQEGSEKRDNKPRTSRVPSRCTSPCCAQDLPPEESPSESMSFVARPWRMVDGKLNRMVCKGMLEALLYHIMSVPGVTLEALLLHYRAVLQPLATLELLQALIDLGCVKRKTLVKRSKASLFSRPAPPPQTGPSTSSCGSREEQPDMVYYEPTVSCVLRLSQVLPHERHWNSDTPGQHPESTLTAP
ncbi:general transcription factor 3C polypeptide 1-like [Periophthalmus magnuspinnatus]|uniref:general transcription factor 3C polypeptide 1-like n=1 Tax=Periophthalmus magnuspinnatus TaxID=409849 RepID=UPI002436699F|nr:general transcription factor 3C polypeptide 1-like [Periophthalmus magnuspinnatus]